MHSPIQTRTYGFTVTLSAIAVCWWALAAEFACGLRAVTAELWGGYMQDRREQRQFDITHPVTAGPVPPSSFERFEQLEQSALDTVAGEIGQPAWLWAAVLAFIVAVALISVVDGWALLFETFNYLRG